MLFGATTLALGAADPKTPATKDAPIPAHEEVRIGNEKLLAGSAEEALQAYARAEALKPDAAEIAFVEGLAHFKLKHFDQARDAFQKATTARNPELATDAMYALGACDHAEALENTEQLPQAISQIESAMKQYRQVLAEDPNHTAAIEANRKAASSWRRFKKKLEQQQQEQKQQSDSDKQDDQQDKDKKQQDNENQDNDSKQKQQDNPQPSDQKENQQKKQEQESKKQQDAADKKKESKEQKQASKKQKEQVTRQQAQRQLREMMEALLQRNKNRREPVELMPAHPVDKDW